MNLRYQLQHGMKSLNYLMEDNMYQTFKITLNNSKKKLEEKSGNPSIRIEIQKIRR